MESVKESFAAMTEYFNERMGEFQKEIQKTSPTAVTTTSLASEFEVFKKIIVATLGTLQQQVEFLAGEIDKVEMRSRRKILLLHGIPEVDSEDSTSVAAEIFAEKLKATGISSESFSRCHRLGRLSGKKPRPMAIKFREAPLRDKIWSEKSKLKGTGITLSDFLIKPRHALFMEARRWFGIKQCWTRDGSIFVLASDGSRHQVKRLADLDVVSKTPAPHSQAPAADTRKHDKVPIARTKRTGKK